ncbi:PREDICTED: chitinase 2-like [Ipomoea nil]|uniref:chitinase 2-like n=1 Tax=Ipomoea nil TaxID=35883 RepID=UPI0009016586|nr:PREDICTED: chitinase 2-like [Ipomoea nil]
MNIQFFITLQLLIFFALSLSSSTTYAGNSKLFREYIGAESAAVRLSDVPINPGVEFHFILAFAIDYTTGGKPSPTDGKFNVFWETNHLSPRDISAIKLHHGNVKVAISLGGDTVTKHQKAYFAPTSTASWLKNAVSSLTAVIEEYNADGIDIDYEHFKSTPEEFAECIGELVTQLKKSGAISFASIAPFEDDGGEVAGNYRALWRKYGGVIDYVNFQFYAYEKLSVAEFVGRFEEQSSKYDGGQLLASFVNKGGGGLGPGDGFFDACRELKGKGKLGGIFVWCADESAQFGFRNEKKSQDLLVK